MAVAQLCKPRHAGERLPPATPVHAARPPGIAPVPRALDDAWAALCVLRAALRGRYFIQVAAAPVQVTCPRLRSDPETCAHFLIPPRPP